ncbi:hypothetical protein [Brevundimonas sp. TWP2-3-2]|uniref:hypothetical protein n=1 Tax=Brevundimonas sp. TWP2-3-2 TaxID=2804648 RepID=UPI003CF56B9E
MNRTTPKLRIYAERLIVGEMSRNASAESQPTAAFAVIEKLSPHFGALMGAGGFRALLSRALALAGAEVAWLGEIQVKADGSFDGLNELEAQAAPEEISDAGIILLARFLGLLVALIGDELTLQLLSNINDLQLIPEGKNGKET